MPRSARSNHRDFEGKLQHILRHAARVFSEKGYEGASIRDISRASGVSLAGLYYYGQSKLRLLYLIQIYTFSSVLRRLEKRLEGTVDPEERFRILVLNHVEYFLQHPEQMKVLSHEDEALEGPYRKELAEIKRRYYLTARGIYEDLRKSGRVQRRLNPRVAVLSLFGMMNWVYTWHNPRVDPGAEGLAETISSIFLEGVANGHGPHASRLSGASDAAGEGRMGAADERGGVPKFRGRKNGDHAGNRTEGAGSLPGGGRNRHLGDE